MAKKPIDLTERLTRQARQAETVDKDPVVPTRMTVTLDQLVPYDNNPRQTRNPAYDDIKASIRHRGLDHAPNITRRPGDEPYMIRDGGNTRLQILRELWEETQDERFYRIDCIFYPWVDEEDALAGHLVENDLRGGMLLIERALAASQWKKMLDERAGEPISQRKAAEAMTERGWKMTQGNLSKLLYAVDYLLPYIPEALWNGGGTPLVEKLRSLERAYRDYWNAIVENSDEAPKKSWETIWTDMLREFDDVKFDLPEFREQLDLVASGALDMSHNTLRMEVDAVLAGEKPSGIKPPHPFSEPAPAADPWAEARAPGPAAAPRPPGSGPVASHPEAEALAARSGLAGAAGQTPSGPANQGVAPSGPVAYPKPEGAEQAPDPALQAPGRELTLADYRDRVFEAVHAYADEFGMGDLVLSTRTLADQLPSAGEQSFGFGFHLVDLATLRPYQALFQRDIRISCYFVYLPNLLFAARVPILHDTQYNEQQKEQAFQNLMACLPTSDLTDVMNFFYAHAGAGKVMEQSWVGLQVNEWMRSVPDDSGLEATLLQRKRAIDDALRALRHYVAEDIVSLFLPV